FTYTNLIPDEFLQSILSFLPVINHESLFRRSTIHAYYTMTRSLPDDILSDIFLRLPDKSLVRLKVLSKHWHLSISRMCVWREEGDEKVHPLLRWDDRWFSIFRLPFRPVAVDLLDCCNGLLLFLGIQSGLYYVCNLLTRKSVSIPSPPFLMLTYCCCALAFDPSHGSTSYKVIRMDCSLYRADFHVGIYYSSDRCWVRHTLKVDPRLRGDIPLSPSVYFNGDLFRLSDTWNLIRFDLKSVSISVTGLPLSYRECNGLMGCIGVQMDRFMYANESCNVLYVWSLDNDVQSWDLKHRINIYDLTSGILLNNADAPDGCHWIEPVAFDPYSNVIYIGSSLVILRCKLDKDYSLEEVCRVDGNVMFFRGCHSRQAFPYIECLVPFTDAGDACNPSFLKNEDDAFPLRLRPFLFENWRKSRIQISCDVDLISETGRRLPTVDSGDEGCVD
ncbi:F-box family protein, partial [Striga asiatica]